MARVTCNHYLRTSIQAAAHTMAYSSPRHSQQFYQYDASTPPPPPPKPGRASGTATPSQGPPLPPPPGQASSFGDPQQHSQTQYQQHGHQVLDQVAVPGPEDGWLPDVLKDKSYVSSCMSTKPLLRYGLGPRICIMCCRHQNYSMR